MKFKRSLALFLACALLQGAFSASAAESRTQPASTKLNMSECKVVNESISHLDATKRGAEILFDSQDLMPETPEKPNIRITGPTWQPNYRIEWGQPTFYVDLGAYYVITDIGYMDMNGAPEITAYQGEPFAWEELGSLPTNYYNTYRVSHFDNARATRYLRVVSKGSDTGINEMALYGYRVRELTESDLVANAPKPADSEKSNLTSGQKIGANAFCDDPYTALAALGNVREYYNWSWLTDEKGEHYFNRVVNKDNFYQTLQGMDISVIPCVQMRCDALWDKNEKWDTVKNQIPVEAGADTLNPESYQLHSNMMYNFAARYGSNTQVDPATLSVGNGDVKIGLNTLDTVESWNEQDKTWETKASYFHPYEYAAMLSADYDGHEGAIANGGVKAADPNFKLAMGGLAGGSKAVRYLSLMKDWFDYNRDDGQFACDVINYHDYITDTEAPEQSSFRQNARNVIAWVNDNAPGRDVWLSEFDVVAKDQSVAGVNNHQNEAYAKARAERLVRAFLVGEREGLDRMSMFMLRDEWSGVYADSGLTTGKGDWDKKTSWYYLSSATDTLKNADLIDVSENGDVYLYTYQDRETSERIYAVWSPTADGSTVANYQLSVGSCEKATMVTPTYGVMEGEKEILDASSGKITLTVSETPVFVKVSGADVPYDHYPQQRIAVQEMRLGEQNGSLDALLFDNKEVVNLASGETPSADNFMLTQFYHMFDEQGADKTAPTPWMKTKVNPSTEMSALPVHKDRAYPYDCIVTFDDVYTFTYIGIYDTYSVGKMDIYDDVTGALLFTSNLDTYNCWRLMPVPDTAVSTNRIRIVKYNDAKLNEMAFYGYPANRKVGVDAEKQPGVVGQPLSAPPKLEVSGVELGQLSLGYEKNQTAVKSAFEKLFDEQNLMPQSSREGVARSSSFATNFSNIWGSGSSFPYDAVITLKERSVVSKMGVFVGWGLNNGPFEVYNNETGELLASSELTGNWKLFYLEFSHPVETGSLRIVKYNSRTICEAAFY